MDDATKPAGKMRYDPVHDRWTILAPIRAARPGGGAALRRARQGTRHQPSCPLCPGNEAMLPSITRERAGRRVGQWSTRVVPNRFPIAVPAGDGFAGVHDVVIETPRHDLDLATLDAEGRASVIATLRDRYRELARRWESVVILRNHGPRAGASLTHPHSQIIALDRPTPGAAALENRSVRHYRRTGRALVHETVQRELEDGGRMVVANRLFGCFVPLWASVPFETWIVPFRRQADFGVLRDGEIGALAEVLGEVLARLAGRVGDPDYNLTIQGASRGRRRAADGCWFVRIRPRMGEPGGFEVASAISVNPSLPERDAAMLRNG